MLNKNFSSSAQLLKTEMNVICHVDITKLLY